MLVENANAELAGDRSGGGELGEAATFPDFGPGRDDWSRYTMAPPLFTIVV